MAMELNEISTALGDLVSEGRTSIRMVVQTGYDETGLVATADGYLRLAQTLVDFVLAAQRQQTETITYGSLTLPTSGAIYSLFHENFEIAIDNLTLASSEDEVKQIADHILRGSPLESEANYKLRMSLSENSVSPTEE